MIVKLEKKERGRKEEGMMSAETAEGEKDEEDKEDREEECYGKGREERVCVGRQQVGPNAPKTKKKAERTSKIIKKKDKQMQNVTCLREVGMDQIQL